MFYRKKKKNQKNKSSPVKIGSMDPRICCNGLQKMEKDNTKNKNSYATI